MSHDVITILSEMEHKLIAFMPKLIFASGILLIFIIIAIIIKKIFNKIVLKKAKKTAPVIRLLSKFFYSFTILIGVITALGTMGINVSALVASLGLSGFALSFALKDSLSNLLAGIMVLIYNPFKIGNNITVGTHTGDVKEINLRYTTLVGENKQFLIPNSLILTQTVSINTPTNT